MAHPMPVSCAVAVATLDHKYRATARVGMEKTTLSMGLGSGISIILTWAHDMLETNKGNVE